MKILIGIDPDTKKNGVAKWNPLTKELDLHSFTFFELFDFLNIQYPGAIVVIEAGWMNQKSNYHYSIGQNKSTGEMIAKKVPVWSGYRSPLCKIGAKLSAHKKGKAADPKGDEQAFFKIVCEFAKELYAMGLRRIENTEYTNGWLHMDTLETNHKAGFIRIINQAGFPVRLSCSQLCSIIVLQESETNNLRGFFLRLRRSFSRSTVRHTSGVIMSAAATKTASSNAPQKM